MKKGRKHLMNCRQGAAMAGVIAVLAGIPAQTVWAIGPGEGSFSSGSTTGSTGPGAPQSTSTGSAGPGGQAGTGSTSSGSSSSTSASAGSNAWRRSGRDYLMPDGSAITGVYRRGIDVSRWQGEINWNQVAADDVSFVMLGTRSKGEVDPYFHKNIQGAVNAGVQVGVYIYSLATTPEMAVEEADFVLNLIKDYPVSYPVALDMEDDVQAGLSKEQLAAIANAFCGRISQAGYYPIIYANDYWLSTQLDMSQMNYPVWVARYSQKPAWSSPVMWQCTSTGQISGINGNVDIDFQFRDFSGVIPANTWRTIGGNTYYYADYAMQKDSWINDGDGWYYMDDQGLALKNWQLLGGERYYLDETSGKMQYGWRMDEGNWYYLGGSGAAQKGWIDDNGTWYFGDRTNAVMQTGWLSDNGQTYYLNSSGQMTTGWIIPDGNWYYMNGSGVLSRGWVNDGKAWYYLDQNGVMQTGWLKDNGSTYFLGDNGVMSTQWRDIEGKRYYFGGDGRMAAGWQLLDGGWYYFDGDGTMATGLREIEGVQYYLNPSDGRMAVDTDVTLGEVTYHADGSGGLSVVMPQEEPAEGVAP